MISEVTFARDFASFWRLATPMMDSFVRRLNAGGYRRDFPPIDAPTAPNRRAFVNEVAYEILCMTITGGRVNEKRVLGDDSLIIAVDAVRRTTVNQNSEGDYQMDLTLAEAKDAKEQVRRLLVRLGGTSYFEINRYGADTGNDIVDKNIITRPIFSGCGIIDRCEGDVLVGRNLYEIKAGERGFRSIDFRQLLVYMSLDHAKRGSTIETVGVINPRVGISYESNASELCYQISGRQRVDLLEFIANAIASGDISR